MVTVKPKEWKNGSAPTMRSFAREREHLRDGLDVRDDVVVREHDAFGDAGAAAGKDHGGDGLGRATRSQQSRWKESARPARARSLETVRCDG